MTEAFSQVRTSGRRTPATRPHGDSVGTGRLRTADCLVSPNGARTPGEGMPNAGPTRGVDPAGVGCGGVAAQRQRVVMLKPAMMNANPIARFHCWIPGIG